MIKDKYIQHGKYSGKMCEFTHYNPADGKIWSDDVEYNEYYTDERTGKRRNRKIFGGWIDSDGVVWEV